MDLIGFDWPQMGEITRSLIKFSRYLAEIRPRLPMCRHAWPRSGEIIYDFIKKLIEIARSLIKLWSRFGRDRTCVDTPGHTSTQFPVPHRPLLWPGIFRKLASPYFTTQNGSSRANRLVGCVGAISPLLGPPRPFCCQRPISPIF